MLVGTGAVDALGEETVVAGGEGGPVNWMKPGWFLLMKELIQL